MDLVEDDIDTGEANFAELRRALNKLFWAVLGLCFTIAGSALAVVVFGAR